jgi:hypothetical protein
MQPSTHGSGEETSVSSESAAQGIAEDATSSVNPIEYHRTTQDSSIKPETTFQERIETERQRKEREPGSP